MKQFAFFRIAFLSLFALWCSAGRAAAIANEPDSAYIFAYSVNEGRSGLVLAYSVDQKEWMPIGPEFSFLFSDFGQWGSQKRMFDPYLFQDAKGLWHCIWRLNNGVNQYAHASSTNLIDWKTQSYPGVMETGDIQHLLMSEYNGEFEVSWESDADPDKIYFNSTKDWKSYSATQSKEKAGRSYDRKSVRINGVNYEGTVHQVPMALIDGLIRYEEWSRFHEQERSELMKDDPARFAGLHPINLNISLKPDASKSISDMLIGVFFEDINYAADGGLYAEMLQNRDFEYDPSDKSYPAPDWNAKMAWTASAGVSFEIDTVSPIHKNNRHFAKLNFGTKGYLENTGWDGIPVKAGQKYDFSVFARAAGTASLKVSLIGTDGEVLAETRISGIGKSWKKLRATLRATASGTAKLRIESSGKADLDFASLFPQQTFHQRKNGLRPDLAQAVADLKPRFVRFPGGCLAHGDGLANIYRWENTIGPLEARVPQRNIWNYHQTAGLGYYEYFQFCEDIGAAPLPVVAAGVPCQNSGIGGHGQQCGIPIEDMDAYVQSILNLIEWANGDANSEWGRKRAAAGHPKPFGLKYLGVGNEDLITDIFEERFTMIFEAIKKKYPEIVVIGTVGPFYKGSDYEAGWSLATNLNVPMVDEHYYQPPGWFINNQDFYDRYSREESGVYLGEYASHVPGRKTNMETALSEALYLTAVERNADVVRMTSYAPLLAKENHVNWSPDLIYFNNTEVKPTTGYYVQQLFSQHAGTRYIPVEKISDSRDERVTRRVGVSVVIDETKGDLIVKYVNLLPVSVSTSLDLSAYDLAADAQVTVMKGAPEDSNILPEVSSGKSGALEAYEMPPYSFSVIRVHLLKP